MQAFDYKKIIPSTDIEFVTNKFYNGKTLWISEQCNLDKQSFSEVFSYAVSSSFINEDLGFDLADKKVMYAERYGGVGIGDNGGGVRVGNYDNYQIKGIGANPLKGSGNNIMHSYGGLTLNEAILETISTTVINKVTPLGAVKVIGLISTGPSAAYDANYLGEPDKKCWGALLVREQAFRPAHLLRAGLYTPNSIAEKPIPPDVARIRLIHKSLLKHFGNTNGFIVELGSFLKNCANQFAFCRVARIAHGNVTPSNLTMDGRWLDMGTVMFLRGGENKPFSATKKSFYEEAFSVIPMVIELVNTFAKYNSLNLNPNALINYYLEQYEAYINFHIPYVYGFKNIIDSSCINLDEYQEITKITKAALMHEDNNITEWPRPSHLSDAVYSIIEVAFFSLSNTKHEPKLPKQISGFDTDKFTREFRELIHKIYELENENWLSFKAFVVSHFLISLKRVLFTDFFFKPRLYNYLDTHLSNGSINEFPTIINHALDASEWLFEDGESKVYLFRSESREFFYCKINGEFILSNHDIYAQHGTETAIIEISKIVDSELTISDFNFKYIIMTILDLTEKISDI